MDMKVLLWRWVKPLIAYCSHCGNDLSNSLTELIIRRQIVDIPPILPTYTEHRVFQSTCACGHKTESSFPSRINAPVSYGPTVEATIAYMHTRQFIPSWILLPNTSKNWTWTQACGIITNPNPWKEERGLFLPQTYEQV